MITCTLHIHIHNTNTTYIRYNEKGILLWNKLRNTQNWRGTLLSTLVILGAVSILPQFVLTHVKSATTNNWMLPGNLHRACRSLTDICTVPTPQQSSPQIHCSCVTPAAQYVSPELIQLEPCASVGMDSVDLWGFVPNHIGHCHLVKGFVFRVLA